jgi:hypothetical protein
MKTGILAELARAAIAALPLVFANAALAGPVLTSTYTPLITAGAPPDSPLAHRSERLGLVVLGRGQHQYPLQQRERRAAIVHLLGHPGVQSRRRDRRVTASTPMAMAQ